MSANIRLPAASGGYDAFNEQETRRRIEQAFEDVGTGESGVTITGSPPISVTTGGAVSIAPSATNGFVLTTTAGVVGWAAGTPGAAGGLAGWINATDYGLALANSGALNRNSLNAALYASLDNFHSGTLTAVTSTTATDSAYSFSTLVPLGPNGVATDYAIAITSGTARGQEVRWSSVTGAHQINLAAWPLGITPSVGDTYVVIRDTKQQRTSITPIMLPPLQEWPLTGPVGVNSIVAPRIVGAGAEMTVFKITGMTTPGTDVLTFDGVARAELSDFGFDLSDITQRARNVIHLQKDSPNAPGADPGTVTTQNIIRRVAMQGWWDDTGILIGNYAGLLVQEDQTRIEDPRINAFRPQQFGTASTTYDTVLTGLTTTSYEDQGESTTPRPWIVVDTGAKNAAGTYSGLYLRNSAGQQWLILDSTAAFVPVGALTVNAALAGATTIRLHAATSSSGALVPGDTLTIGGNTYNLAHVANADNQGTGLTDIDISPAVPGGGFAGGTAVTVTLSTKTALSLERGHVGGYWPTPANAAGHKIVSRRCNYGIRFHSNGSGNNLIHNVHGGWVVGAGHGIAWNGTCGSAMQTNMQNCDVASYVTLNHCHYIVIAPAGRDEGSYRYYQQDGSGFITNIDLVGAWTDSAMYSDTGASAGTGFPSTGDIISLSCKGTVSIRQFAANSDKPGLITDPVKLCIGYSGANDMTLIADGVNIFGSAVNEAFRINGQGGGMRVIGRGYKNSSDARGEEDGDFKIGYAVVPRTEYVWSGRNGALAATPTITGSRGGNAALASLLTALAARNILVDSST